MHRYSIDVNNECNGDLRLEIKHKQRIIGIMVLMSLCIIFLPSLFQRDQRIAVDTTSLITAKPIVAPVVIAAPVKPQNIKPAPSPDKAFQPKILNDDVSSEVSLSSPVKTISTPKSELKKPSKQVLKPSLDDKGIPNAWVIQVGSFTSQVRADELKDKLLKKDYKAYTRAVNTSKGEFFRVFTGPYIDKARSNSAKKAIDSTYKVNSRVVRFAPE